MEVSRLWLEGEPRRGDGRVELGPLPLAVAANLVRTVQQAAFPAVRRLDVRGHLLQHQRLGHVG